jgi:hypothetical protein
MRAEAPASGQCRPPTTTVAGHAGASLSPTVRIRPTVPARLAEAETGLVDVGDPYVRRFWVAAIGPSAVAEVMRVTRAAEKGEDVRLPRHLPMFLRLGFVRVSDGCLIVPSKLPVVPPELRWRFPPGLAAEHSRWLNEQKSSNRPNGARREGPSTPKR